MMDGSLGETTHAISFCRFNNSSNSNKKYKEQKINEIATDICAMLNANGGGVLLYNNCNHKDLKCISQMSQVVRILEQFMIAVIGLDQTVSKINFTEGKESIKIMLKKADIFVTKNYHLYLPSQKQVVQVSSLEPLENIRKNIIYRTVIVEPVQLGSHRRTFCKGKNCGLHENKLCEFKNLKAKQSNCTSLADRMTGKGNKLSCYVSAFANYSGGHIYYGVEDDGVVEGELIPNEKDKEEIIKKVAKVINKMIWPEQIGQPKRGEQWEIFFEPVKDANSQPVPSTFVIVIYIAPCLGGVFTEEPECYEMTEGKVQKMLFISWKRKIQQPRELGRQEIPDTVKRITWNSKETRTICLFADQLLTQHINKGKSVQSISIEIEESYPELIEVRLIVLSKKVMACYRSGSFPEAERFLKEYFDLLVKASEFGIFDAIGVYIQTALFRTMGDTCALSNFLAVALDKAEIIAPGQVTAALYLLVATILTLVQLKNDHGSVSNTHRVSSDALSIRALEHLQYVKDSPTVRADLELKAHLSLALFHLACDRTGGLTKKDINSESLERAKASVTAIERNPMTNYRRVQFNIVQSVLSYRCSQVQADDEKVSLLKQGFDFAKTAEKLASKCKFVEMLHWARACMALCTEMLIRTHFKA